ncbi:MAG: hypothetical protein K2W95_26740 [Candidatus Obscuribacterales bacterium]|nr:hypothetical protein [Candidatus Obscuribacterales bacterium]
MKTIVEASFSSRDEALSAANEVNRALQGVEARIDPAPNPERSATVATVESGRHDRLMMQLGVFGIVSGCTVGFLAIPQVPQREIMHLLILPLSGAFWGLGLALTAAMLLSDSLEHFWSGTEEVVIGAAPKHQIVVRATVNGLETADAVHTILTEQGATWISQEEVIEDARTPYLQAAPTPSVPLLSKTA